MFFLYSRCLNRTMKVDLHTETTVRMLLISPSLPLSLTLSLFRSCSLVVVVTLLHPHGLSTRCRRTCRCVLFLRSCRGTHTQCSGGRGRWRGEGLPIFIGIPGRRLHKVRQEQRIDAIFMRHHSHLIRIIDCVSKLPAIYSHCHSQSHSHSQQYSHSQSHPHSHALQLQHYYVVSIYSGQRAYRDSC